MKFDIVSTDIDYLKPYRWMRPAGTNDRGTYAIMSYSGVDIVLELVEDQPIFAESWVYSELYSNLLQPPEEMLNYIRTWSNSGLYKSIPLRKFMDEVYEPQD
jgi:hypothetical protein